MLRKLRRLLLVGITTLFIVFSVVMLALLLPGGVKFFSVQTGSMEPNLSPGDLVLVRKKAASEYRVGDVVTFINPANRRETITHRIAERADESKQVVFTTKGDANTAADRPISENLIIGKQIASLPLLGHAIDFIRTIPGLLLIIWLPALFIVVGETRRLSAHYRSIRPYKYSN